MKSTNIYIIPPLQGMGLFCYHFVCLCVLQSVSSTNISVTLLSDITFGQQLDNEELFCESTLEICYQVFTKTYFVLKFLQFVLLNYFISLVFFSSSSSLVFTFFNYPQIFLIRSMHQSLTTCWCYSSCVFISTYIQNSSCKQFCLKI